MPFCPASTLSFAAFVAPSVDGADAPPNPGIYDAALMR